MRISQEIRDFLKKDGLERFFRYVKIHTASDDESESSPSTERQFDLAKILVEELKEIGIQNVEMDEYCYVYGVLPASEGYHGPAISFCSHMDTSPDAPGVDVKPIIHKNYDGGDINFPDNPDLKLNPQICPELNSFIGQDIITASGTTLLGADNKAGIAEIMSSLAVFSKYPELKHPELKIVFTPDEEVGRGVNHINTSKLGQYCYTFDGGMIGELETECFDAHFAKIHFTGNNVHPGYAKNKMVNACSIAARYFTALPEWQTPERSEKREGFFHLIKISGDTNQAEIQMIIRDFDSKKNQDRISLLKSLKDSFEKIYPGLKIDVEVKEQYKNMKEVLDKYPEVTEIAAKAITEAEIEIIHQAIRGGTDGARLSFMGIPTPNIFAGGLLFHSIKEWMPVSALEKASEVLINICRLWYEKK